MYAPRFSFSSFSSTGAGFLIKYIIKNAKNVSAKNEVWLQPNFTKLPISPAKNTNSAGIELLIAAIASAIPNGAIISSLFCPNETSDIINVKM